jgi:anaerobic selenocysteine-containing dehydrogenase
MNCGSRVPFFSNAKEREIPWLRTFMREPIVRLSPKDAASRALVHGDYVRVSSPVNEAGIVFRLEVSATVKPGCIDVLHGWPEANANELIPRDFDPISGFPPYKEGLCEVRLEQSYKTAKGAAA